MVLNKMHKIQLEYSDDLRRFCFFKLDCRFVPLKGRLPLKFSTALSLFV